MSGIPEIADWASISGGVFSFGSVLFAFFVSRTVRRIRKDVYLKHRIPILLIDLEKTCNSFSPFIQAGVTNPILLSEKASQAKVLLERLHKASINRSTSKKTEDSINKLTNFMEQLRNTGVSVKDSSSGGLESTRRILYDSILESIEEIRIDIKDRDKEVFP